MSDARNSDDLVNDGDAGISDDGAFDGDANSEAVDAGVAPQGNDLPADDDGVPPVDGGVVGGVPGREAFGHP